MRQRWLWRWMETGSPVEAFEMNPDDVVKR